MVNFYLVMCMDCKLSFDDNALFRHKELVALRDVSQEDSREVDAAQYDLNYIGLDGSIGCLGKYSYLCRTHHRLVCMK